MSNNTKLLAFYFSVINDRFANVLSFADVWKDKSTK